MVRDPVCGISLEVDHALRVNYHGKTYYFCSHDCKVNFEDRPDEYAQPTQVLPGETLSSPIDALAKAIQVKESNR